MTSRDWCFTLNNYTLEEEGDVQSFVANKLAVFVAMQREVGDKGTPHLQGVLVAPSPCRITHVRKLIPRAHWERRLGTLSEALAYAIKDDTREEGATPFVDGKRPVGQGKRSDLRTIGRMVVGGYQDYDVSYDFPGQFIRYHKGIRALRQVHQSHAGRLRNVQVYFGPTGVGKTSLAIAQANKRGSVYYLSSGNSKNIWFDHYSGQTTIIVDDFFGWLRYSFMLRFLDRYPFLMETKGGTTWMLHSTTHIVFTSNSEPGRWYRFNECSLLNKAALLRRITTVRDFATHPISDLEKSLYNLSFLL